MNICDSRNLALWDFVPCRSCGFHTIDRILLSSELNLHLYIGGSNPISGRCARPTCSPLGNSILIDHVVHRHHYRFPRPSLSDKKKIIAIIQRNEEATYNISWTQIRAPNHFRDNGANTNTFFLLHPLLFSQAYHGQQPLPRLRTTRFRRSAHISRKERVTE